MPFLEGIESNELSTAARTVWNGESASVATCVGAWGAEGAEGTGGAGGADGADGGSVRLGCIAIVVCGSAALLD